MESAVFLAWNAFSEVASSYCTRSWISFILRLWKSDYSTLKLASILFPHTVKSITWNVFSDLRLLSIVGLNLITDVLRTFFMGELEVFYEGFHTRELHFSLTCLTRFPSWNWTGLKHIIDFRMWKNVLKILSTSNFNNFFFSRSFF